MHESETSAPPTDGIPRPTIGLIHLGLWVGLSVGVAELGVLGLLEFVLDRYIYYISPQTVWMIPVADIVIFGALGSFLFLAERVWPRRITLPVAVWMLSFVGFTAVAYFADDRLHDIALLLLAAGAATQTARMIRARPAGFSRFVRRSGPIVAACVLIAAAVAEARGPLRERAALARLPAAEPGAPNVLLIIWDTVRAHDLSAYGYERSTTPALDDLADTGSRFDLAMSTASWTLPSHASMFTGHYPNDLSVNYTTPLDDAEPTLAEALRAKGYATGGFVANFGAAGWESGAGRGFIRYEDFPRSVGQMFISARLVRTLLKVHAFRRLIGFYDVLGRKRAPVVSQRFLDWQADHPSRPFFAFLNYYDAHAPYLPPGDYATRFGPARPHADPLLIERMNEPSRWAPESLQAELDAYDGAIAYLDDQLSAVLGELERRGELDNTLVIVTSDHGEEFGEHEMLGHGDFLWAPLIRVPLVVALPGRVPAGVTVDEPVTLRSLPSTVLDLLEIDDGSRFPGISLAETWQAHQAVETDAPHAPEPAAARPRDTQLEPVYSHEEGLTSVVVGRYHYIVAEDGEEHLFDIVADPLEQTDLRGSPDHAEMLARLRSLGSR